jgi:hypothetical protein
VPPESDDSLHLEIGHVLFIDIVSYSKVSNTGMLPFLNKCCIEPHTPLTASARHNRSYGRV